MTIRPPSPPENAARCLDLVGLMGLLRFTLFESFGDRKYWDEHYYDLFMSMLAKQLRGTVSTLEEMMASMPGISQSTKIRMIEEARKDGHIVAVNRSRVELDGPLDNIGARKVFFLSEDTLGAMCASLTEMIRDVETFSALAQRDPATGEDASG